MFNKTEKSEKKYLSYVINTINDSLSIVNDEIIDQENDIKGVQAYYIENFNEIDPSEQASVNNSLDFKHIMLKHLLKKKDQILRILNSPYFGRVDFVSTDETDELNIYIGINNFDIDNKPLIYDWRAPISSLYYNFEKGDCSYEAPSGIRTGTMTLKRQYRIRDGVMEYMVDTSLQIYDDILQKELSHTSSIKMKNIISTIQREQNLIIRDDSSDIILIQGVAGSGKTSIALHRAAFLLYRYKESLKSNNILIISPNKVFANYISNVLPELGEENLVTIETEELAELILDGDYKIESFYQQTDAITNKQTTNYIDNIKYKSSFEFANRLEDYIHYIKENSFISNDIKIRKYLLNKDDISNLYKKVTGKTVSERIERLADILCANFESTYYITLGIRDKTSIHKQLKNMFIELNPSILYVDFFKWIGREDLKPRSKKYLDYIDVFPYLYLKIMFDKIEHQQPVKYLIVDEMQDYTPIQYKFLNKYYNCNMTILGDENQAVNPYSSTNINDISKIFPYATSIELNKSYRSTFEIMNFAQKIIYNKKLQMIERHGDKPVVKKVKSSIVIIQQLIDMINDFNNSAFNSIGIICKTQKQADKLHEDLSKLKIKTILINSLTKIFTNGVIIVSSSMSKGLEFDQVIIPYVNSTNFSNEIDKYLLYIACTRAMHKLIIIYHGTKSRFLPD